VLTTHKSLWRASGMLTFKYKPLTLSALPTVRFAVGNSATDVYARPLSAMPA